MTPTRPLLLALLLSACGVTADWSNFSPAPAQGLPTSFTPPLLPAGGEPTACLSPLTDPQDGSRVKMVRARNDAQYHIGDYAVEGGRYGMAPDELLRVDCRTWRPLGVVPR